MLIAESAMQQSGVCYRRLPLLLVPPKGLWQTSDFFFIIKVKAVDARNKLPHPLSTWGRDGGLGEAAPISNFKTRKEFLLTFGRRAKPRIFANTKSNWQQHEQ